MKINLVAVAVKAFSAAAPAKEARVSFHMVHSKCGNRIHYKKVCPVHGEVPNDEIVSGYEYDEGQYVTFTKKELNKLKLVNEKTIDLAAFIPADALDPLYFAGRTYYLVPNDRPSKKSYAVIQRAMRNKNCYGLGEVIFAGKEQLVAIRPVDNLLVMSLLHYEHEVKGPTTFEKQAIKAAPAKRELDLAESLIDAARSDEARLASWREDYQTKLRKLIAAKAEGRTLKIEEEEEPGVINLMAALKRSIELGRKAPDRRRKLRSRRPAARRKTG